jgi:uncharacterized membrane protein
MNQVLISLSTWLHALATVVFIGHFVLLAVLYLPTLSAQEGASVAGPILSGVSKRSRRWLYASLIVFAVTGIHLMLVDPNYKGVGNFGNFWAVMMLVKHILISVMIALGFWYNAILRVGPLLSSNDPAAALIRFRKYVNVMAVCGVLVLLLTALSQTQ